MPPGGPGAAPGPQPAAAKRPGRSPQPNRPGAPRVRKARLKLARLDPWSVMKTAFVLSIAFAIISVVATAILWVALKGLGVFSSLTRTVGDLTGSSKGSFNLGDFLSFPRVMGFTLIVSIVDIILMTALATLGAYLYNIAADMSGGGVELTLAEDH